MQKHQISLYGMILGVLALTIVIINFNFGPFSSKPPIETRMAEKIISVKNNFVAGLQGKELPIVTKKQTITIDNIMKITSFGLSVTALFLAFIGRIRKEDDWIVSGAIIFGGGTLVFHAILFSISILFLIMILIIALCLFFSFISF